ncbi:unnamed protein product [Diatraea saccharalis]|uniref:Uncharacterized protein n=1 Tax=Diatraea saccharalis TaxID=40085 RepID=A0A9N9R5Z7_9NEOP|nr:unnamed protein product [Diatraea saccharalis]
MVLTPFVISQSKDLNMKVLAALVFAIGSAVAIGSGPYLPSGWRPQGPAFSLPSDIQKPAPIDIVLQESEGSSSDFLREYGPPIVQTISQTLPDVSTEQPFVVIEAKFGEDDTITVGATTEIIAELESEVIEDTPAATESVNVDAEEQSGEVNQVNIESKSDIESSVAEESPVSVESEEIVAVNTDDSSVNARIEVEVEENEKIIEQGVKNIAEAIVSLEKEVVEKVPEGFLEYGPPGFREYGPPNQNALLRSGEEEKTEAEKIDSNETRRRRFSPKFRYKLLDIRVAFQ